MRDPIAKLGGISGIEESGEISILFLAERMLYLHCSDRGVSHPIVLELDIDGYLIPIRDPAIADEVFVIELAAL